MNDSTNNSADTLITQDIVKKNIRLASGHNSGMLLLFLGLTLILSSVVQIYISIFNKDAESSTRLLLIIGTLLQYLVSAPLILIIARSTKEGKKYPKISSLFCKPQVSYKQIAKWILISFFIGRAAAVVSAYFFKLVQLIIGKEFTSIDLSSNGSAYNNIFNIVAFTILAPVCEELIFRGIITNNSSRFGNMSAIITSGIFFGLYHMNYEQIIYAAVLGMCCGFIFIKTKSLIPCILMHMFFNFFGSVASLFPSEALTNIQKMDLQYINDHIILCLALSFVLILTTAVMIAGLIVMIIEIQNNKDSFKIEKIHTELSESKKILEYLKSPLTITLTLILILLTVINAFSNI